MKNRGGIDWDFPIDFGYKRYLEALVNTGFIDSWHLAHKTAKIVLRYNENQYYRVRCGLEIAGLLKNYDAEESILNQGTIRLFTGLSGSFESLNQQTKKLLDESKKAQSADH